MFSDKEKKFFETWATNVFDKNLFFSLSLFGANK
jgi:hypothetical protein